MTEQNVVPKAGAAASGPTTVTAAIECAAAPPVAIALLRDARRLPDWAPGFVDRVDPDGGAFRAHKDNRKFTLRVAAHTQAGTVDYLREIAPGREGGAYLRVVPGSAAGSVVIMTIPARPDEASAAATLRAELTALRGLIDEARDDQP